MYPAKISPGQQTCVQELPQVIQILPGKHVLDRVGLTAPTQTVKCVREGLVVQIPAAGQPFVTASYIIQLPLGKNAYVPGFEGLQ